MGGSSSTQSTQIPDYMSDASRLAVQRANQIFEAGRMPYTGIDVVGLNPSEKAAMENVASAASAFGMAVPQGDPFAGMEAQTTNGLTGYSSMPIYISDMQRLKEQRPDQYAAFAKLTGFDPITGERIAPPPAPVAPAYHNTSYMERNTDRDDGVGMFAPVSSGASRQVTVTRDDGTTYTSNTPRPILSPGSRGGALGFEDKVRLGVSSAVNNSPIGRLFGALTNRA